MRFVFIQTRTFTADVKCLRLTFDDLRRIESEILRHSDDWPVIAGTHGLRKMRFASESSGAGKSGGIRVCYFIVDNAGHVYLVTAFAKNEKANINAEDRNAIAMLITRIKSNYMD